MEDDKGGGLDPGGGGGGASRPPAGESGKGGGNDCPSPPPSRRGGKDEGDTGVRGHKGLGGHLGHSGTLTEGSGYTPKKTLFGQVPTNTTPNMTTSQTTGLASINTTHTLTPERVHQNTIDGDSAIFDDSQVKHQSTPVQHKKKTPEPPTHTIREWTLNRKDGKLYNLTGESRIPTSEEWRAFKLLDIQWQNKQAKLKQQQTLQQQKQKQQQQRRQLQQQRLKEIQDKKSTDSPNRDKRNRSQVDTSTEDKTMEQKKQKTDEETTMDDPQVDWNSDAVKHSTIRVLADKDDQPLTQDDIQHLNRHLMRATFQECKGDLQKWRRLQPDKMSLMHPNFVIRLRLPSKEGVEFWRSFIPTVPPKSEGGYKYKFLAPGENLTEKVCFFVADAKMAENKPEDLEMLAFTIKAGNDGFEQVPIKLRCTGIEKKSCKAIMIMDIPTADRLRCLGPKPDNPDTDPDWKIRIGLSNHKVTVAYSKSNKVRRENTQARLTNRTQDQASTSPKQSTSKDLPKSDDELDMDAEQITDALKPTIDEEDDDILEGIALIEQQQDEQDESTSTTQRITMEDIGEEDDITDLT